MKNHYSNADDDSRYVEDSYTYFNVANVNENADYLNLSCENCYNISTLIATF